ncbi:MAG: protein phosphatase 2C domain-containing protein [Clostridiales Family XIII bacterium]|nr:protein phosphatase 2C domain-containing protein [Clostridiales Family XIII bacterium]
MRNRNGEPAPQTDESAATAVVADAATATATATDIALAGPEGGFAEVVTASVMHIGTRPYQQDALYVTGFDRSSEWPEGQGGKAFGILCDGMGGLDNGEKASNMAVYMVKESLENLESFEDIPSFFAEEAARIDLAIQEECSGEGKSAGTTLTAVVIFGGDLYWASVGDSRIYIIREGDIVKVNRDHTYMMLLRESVRKGNITPEEAENHPLKASLISFLGSGHIRYIDTNENPFRLVRGDIVLLCSDGLTKSLTPAEILDVVESHYGDMDSAANDLVIKAFDSSDGPKDNTSVVLLQYFE